jgi:hypothetical protein
LDSAPLSINMGPRKASGKCVIGRARYHRAAQLYQYRDVYNGIRHICIRSHLLHLHAELPPIYILFQWVFSDWSVSLRSPLALLLRLQNRGRPSQRASSKIWATLLGSLAMIWNMTQGRQYGVKLWYKGKDRVGPIATGHYVSYSKISPASDVKNG